MTEAQKARKYLGRRGAVLLILGIIWGIVAVNVGNTPTPSRPLAPHERLPDIIRILIWGISSLVAIFCAFLRRPGRDRWGYFALIFPVAERAGSWLLAIFFEAFHFFPPAPPLSTSVSNVAFYGALTFLVITIAGWPETSERVVLKLTVLPDGGVESHTEEE